MKNNLLVKIKEKPESPHEQSFTIVAIGASVGGLEAICELLKNISPDTGMAFIYVQHLNPDHKSLLTSILAKMTTMKVQEIENMEHILPNNVYVIPTNQVIEVTDGHIKLLPRTKNTAVISIDVLFSSLAKTHHEKVIGIILSGNASDGTNGLKAIKEAGGITFAQDDTAQASSMPQSAIDAGIVDFVLSPKAIAHKLENLSNADFNKTITNETEVQLENPNADLDNIFNLLRTKMGVDFSHYKMPTIKRRITHKMKQCGIKTIKEYVIFLQKNDAEIALLYKDLLINVTNFFRDSETFYYLESIILPKLLKNKTAEESLRIWIPACSTGEEAYSIAMLVDDLRVKKNKKILVQIFATDLSEEAIQTARLGEYSQRDVKNIPQKYLNRYFSKAGENYRVMKELRDLCVFAPHNILRDPPFSRMDFVSCCNLLIYFDSSAQKKVFTTLHFALNDTGFLMLGKAETIGTTSQLFTQVNSKFKIYTCKKSNGMRRQMELQPRFPRTIIPTKKINIPTKNISVNPAGIENAIDAVLLASYMPACAVINKDMEILQFRGPISFFLEHQSGKASLHILKMARPEFAFELRNAIHEVIKTKQNVQKTGIEIKIDNAWQLLSFEVSPLKIDWEEPLIMIVFTLHKQADKARKGDKSSLTLRDQRIKKLTDELNSIRKEINTITDLQEITFEELQVANEEIVSSNEEYQTLNEELETSREEIEVTNEELISSNQELHMRNNLLTEAYDYSEAIIATIHEPMLVLDKNFAVKSANKSFYEKFLFKKQDTEGVSLFDLGDKQWNIPALKVALEDIILLNGSFEKFHLTHKFKGIGEKSLLLNGNLILQKVSAEQLILLAIEDITEQKKIENNLAQSLKEVLDYRYALDASSIVDVADEKGIINYVNENYCKISQYTPAELIGKNHKVINSGYHPKAFIKGLWDTITSGKIWQNELRNKAKDGSYYWVNSTIVPFLDEEQKPYQFVAISIDITEQKMAEKELMEAKVFAELATSIAEEAQIKAEKSSYNAEEAMKAKQQFLSNMSHEIRTPLNAIIGFTKIVLKTSLEAKQKEYLTAIKMSGDALIVLINDILDLAKVDAGKMIFEKTPFKLASSVATIIRLFETKSQEKNLLLKSEIDSNIPEVLIGDAARLHQIMLNLVSNALKFTAKGHISLNIRLLNEDAEKVTIQFSVEDTGIGIASDKLETIFENFQQASSETSRLYGGTGLGLAIAKQLVESQGGVISLKSSINEGSTFTFVLTFFKTEAKAEEEIELIPLDNRLSNVNVLVAEDMPLNQLLIKTLLDDFNFECDIAENGKIAIEKLQTKEYDIILMDLQMPEMNGFEATEYIRNTLQSNIPIIALTADVTTADVAKCKEVGMNEYIAKPVDERLLYTLMVGLIPQKILEKVIEDEVLMKENSTIITYLDLTYLGTRTKNNPKLMIEMISIYLKQTPILINVMKQSLLEKDWQLLQATVHKMIPSFSIMGIKGEHENVAKRIYDYAGLNQPHESIHDLVAQLEFVCEQACKELELELERINNL